MNFNETRDDGVAVAVSEWVGV